MSTRRFLNCPNSNVPAKRSCDAFYWIDPELNNGWYKNQMIELYLALNPYERYQYMEQLRLQDRFEMLQAEHEVYQPDMEFKQNEARKMFKLFKEDGDSLSDSMDSFHRTLLQKSPIIGIVYLWLQVQIFYDHVNPATRGRATRHKTKQAGWPTCGGTKEVNEVEMESEESKKEIKEEIKEEEEDC
ncbi:hypothetical protein Tco_0635715 [Tanacetum coccineum]